MAKKPNDDLFEGTTMSFGDHLEELRVCLFRGVAGLAVGCLIGLLIANNVVAFFQSPLERAMQRYYLDKALADLGDDHRTVSVEERRMILDEGLIREQLQIEVGQVAEMLRLTYPGVYGELELSPYWFTAGDLHGAGAASLAQQLIAAGKSTTASPQRRVWQLLSAAEQKMVEPLAASGVSLTPQQTSDLLTALNRVATLSEIHQSSEMAGLSGPDADPTLAAPTLMAWLIGSGGNAEDTVAKLRKELAEPKKLTVQATGEKTRRLNKLLIARAFPESLRKARVNLLVLHAWRPVKVRFQVLNAQEAFMIWLKAALVTGLVIASPYLFYQIWIFVAAGLYPHEKNYVFLYVPISIALFFGGASLAFLFVFDPVLDFLFTFIKGMNADFDPRIGEWLGFVLILPLGFGVSFQLPLIMLFVNRIGLVSVETYIAQWRIAILTIFVIAMVLTPADPVSMLLMAGPLCVLYLLGIVMCKYMPRGRNAFAEAYEP